MTLSLIRSWEVVKRSGYGIFPAGSAINIRGYASLAKRVIAKYDEREKRE